MGGNDEMLIVLGAAPTFSVETAILVGELLTATARFKVVLVMLKLSIGVATVPMVPPTMVTDALLKMILPTPKAVVLTMPLLHISVPPLVTIKLPVAVPVV